MSLFFEEDIRKKAVLNVAESMLAAARTAPKASGVDRLVMAVAEGDTIQKLAGQMKKMVQDGEARDFFTRDADNILRSEAVVLIGTKIKAHGLDCGLCGFPNCAEKNKNPGCPCIFNTGDLGIAIGSAVSIAADARIDNRIMYSVGQAARRLGLLGEDVKIVYGIPLCCSGKSPFFDRG